MSAKFISVSDFAKLLGGVVDGDGSVVLTGVAPLDVAGPNDLSFLTNRRYFEQAKSSNAACIICKAEHDLVGRVRIIIDDPHLGYIESLKYFFPEHVQTRSGISHSAVIDRTATISETAYVAANVCIGALCLIGDRTQIHSGVVLDAGCVVGSDCVIHPGAVLYRNTVLGDHVIIHANAVLGSDGFGFHPSLEIPTRIPQVGRVVIGDDVEIGPMVCVERATLTETRIETGTKIGGLTYIGHNVVIGRNAIIVGQTGIAGSAKIGDACRIWGQSFIRGHRSVGHHSRVRGRSFVWDSLPPKSDVGGNPAVPVETWRRTLVAMRKLPTLLRKLRKLSRNEEN